jgi:hypothetical protein
MRSKPRQRGNGSRRILEKISEVEYEAVDKKILESVDLPDPDPGDLLLFLFA